MKLLLKYKKWILTILFVIPLSLSFSVQYYENILRYDYWNYKILEKLNIVSYDEINKLKSKNDIENLKETKKEIIRNFKPSSLEYKDFSCFKKFNTNTDGIFDIIIHTLGIFQFETINDKCFREESKLFLFISYIFTYLAIFFTIIVLFIDKIRRRIIYQNHIAIIGLNKYSREIINQIRQKNVNIKIYDNNNSNKYIKELENNGEIIINGELEYTIVNNNCEIINAKEIYIINDSDAESINNLALLLDKFNDKNINRKIKNKTKIYLQLINRENKAFFNANGIYKLISNNYEIYIFSINEIIVQNMFKDKSLVSNVKNENNKYTENLKVLIVGFNDLSEEILYTILKLGHFDIDSIVEITVIDDNHELLCSKFNKLIEKGIRPYEKNNKYLWKLNFLPYKSFYNLINNDYNRIILCDKKLNNNLDNLNFLYNNFCVKLKEKNTIVNVFNEHNAINNAINKDRNYSKNFLTFGDIESTITLDNIRKNKLYLVAEYTNDFKETDENKKWKNLDSFTIESNITEKLHMNIKLNYFGFKINCRNNYGDNKINNFVDDYIKKVSPYFLDRLNHNEEINEFRELPYVFDNFIKNENFKIFEDIKSDLKCINNEEIFSENNNNEFKLNICLLLSSFELFLKLKKYKKDQRENIVHNLAQIEHARWNAIHILNGWERRERIEVNQKIERKDLVKKEHFDLCDWETLNKEDKEVIKYDYKNIYHIPFVAYCLGFDIIEINNKDNE